MRWLLLAAAAVGSAAAHAAEEVDSAYPAYLEAVRARLPDKGTPLFDGARLSDCRFSGQGKAAEFSFVAVEGQPFGRVSPRPAYFGLVAPRPGPFFSLGCDHPCRAHVR
jgi:hypothetical protein